MDFPWWVFLEQIHNINIARSFTSPISVPLGWVTSRPFLSRWWRVYRRKCNCDRKYSQVLPTRLTCTFGCKGDILHWKLPSASFYSVKKYAILFISSLMLSFAVLFFVWQCGFVPWSLHACPCPRNRTPPTPRLIEPFPRWAGLPTRSPVSDNQMNYHPTQRSLFPALPASNLSFDQPIELTYQFSEQQNN